MSRRKPWWEDKGPSPSGKYWLEEGDRRGGGRYRLPKGYFSNLIKLVCIILIFMEILTLVMIQESYLKIVFPSPWNWLALVLMIWYVGGFESFKRNKKRKKRKKKGWFS